MPSTDTAAATPGYAFAVACGCYFAAWVAPAATAAATLVTSDPGALYVLLLAVGVVCIAVGTVAARRTPGLAVRAGRREWLWVLACLPFVWFPAGFVGATAADSEALVAVGMVGAVAGLAAGLGVFSSARTSYADASLDGATERIEVTARWPPRARRAAVVASAVAGVAAAAGVAASLFGGPAYEAGFYLLYLLPAVVPSLTWTREEYTVRVTDAGVGVQRGFVRRFRPWDRWTRYAVTEEAVVIERTGWRPAMRLDRADVDAEALAAALAQSLPAR